MKEWKRVVLKIGSSLLLNERAQISRKFLRDIAGQVKKMKERKIEAIIVSSGAIACGMKILGIKKKPKEIQKKQAIASCGQVYLMELYRKAFEKEGLKIGQILMTHEDIKDRKRCFNLTNTLNVLLSMGIIPIVNENDSISFEEIRFGDNDNLSALIAQITDADLLILLSDVEGLYDRDPKRYGNANIIKAVQRIDREIENIAEGTRSERSIGGMKSKIEAAKKAVYFGIPTRIVKGDEKDVILRLLDGEDIGTLFLPQKRLSRKEWLLAFAFKSKGSIIIDVGAKKAIIFEGKSLLPSGIRQVKGEFLRGDCVEIEDEEGKLLARGITNYSSKEIEMIKGFKSIDIEKKLGYKYTDEIIHRNNMVVTYESL